MAHALRFVAGKYTGGEFPLRPNRELIIGRGSEFDMVLDEDMVSRRHTKIATYHGQIVLQDLKSTNGTFVNGERVSVARLKIGDKILVGTSLMEVILKEGTGISLQPPGPNPISDLKPERTVEQPLPEPPGPPKALESPSLTAPPQPEEPPQRKAQVEESAQRKTLDRAEGMSGRFPDDDVSVADLVELFSANGRTGVLVLTDDEHREGRVYFREGQICFATIAQPQGQTAEAVYVPPLKSFFRLLGWQRGSFRMDSMSPPAFEEEIEGNPRQLLVEGLRQYDELKRYEAHLPRSGQRLLLAVPLEPRLSALSPEALDTLQVAVNCAEFRLILDYSEATDLETCQDLLYLLQNGYLVVMDP